MKHLVIITLLFFSICIHAQEKMNLKWGDIPEEDLAMTIYDKDSSASAVVLEDLTKMWLTSSLEDLLVAYEHHTRIKILTSEGLDQGDIDLVYFSRNDLEYIRNLKVQVIQPDGSKYELSKKEKRKENTSKYLTTYKIAIPQVQIGSIIEYKYRLESKRIITLEDWNFQREIPVRRAQLEVDFPNEVEYQPMITNANYIYRRGPFYSADYIPAMQEESFITTMEDYRGRVRFQLKRYDNGYYKKEVFTSWGKIAYSLIHDKYFGEQYSNKKNYKNLLKAVQSIVDNLDLSEKQKINELYAFILEKVKWDGNYSLTADRKIDDCFKNGEANSGEMNLMMLALLKASNIEAYPAVLSPRSEGKMYQFHPFLEQFRHMIVQVKLKDTEEVMYVDLSDKWRPAGLPAVNSLNGRTWLITDEKYYWIDLVPSYGEDIFLVNASIDDSGELAIEMRGKYTGYNAIPERIAHDKNKDSEHWAERFKSNFPDFEIVESSCENLKEINKAFKDQFKANVPGAVQNAGDILYVSPILYSSFTENPFKLKERTYPVDFSYPFGEKYVFQFEIPEQYVVDELPESVNFKLPDGSASYKMISSASGSKIQVISQFKLKKSVFNQEEYIYLKSLFDRMIEKQGEQIVLKKKT
jgi:hypothetical protein